MTIEKDGKIVSALQIVPLYDDLFGYRDLGRLYLRGVHSSGRKGKGLCDNSCKRTFEEMERREIAISALIPADPWLFDYYREQGYTEAFDYSVETYIRPEYAGSTPEDNGYPTGVYRQPTNCSLISTANYVNALPVSCTRRMISSRYSDLQLDNGGMYTALTRTRRWLAWLSRCLLRRVQRRPTKCFLSRNFFTTRKRSRNYYCKSLPCKITYRKRRSIPLPPLRVPYLWVWPASSTRNA